RSAKPSDQELSTPPGTVIPSSAAVAAVPDELSERLAVRSCDRDVRPLPVAGRIADLRRLGADGWGEGDRREASCGHAHPTFGVRSCTGTARHVKISGGSGRIGSQRPRPFRPPLPPRYGPGRRT